MIDLSSLPIGRSFSCPMEEVIWLCRHQEDPLVKCWWIGYEAARREVCFDRVVWEIENQVP